MSAQGLKTSDPAPIDTKPGDRRRGAAGRAAALRRAPSDSDCSGETASLSADSGERRPPPPPPRSGKTRSRRRGSEWEVLEGLKDGQRFERRPEVFNGFLHKKRKWPLKGWHKRFFVVDGGILVYARSPTDVARGRLHGSLDVGLSVISAKPRRRRIDIDADEFIYHLRAKTPDVFRTWLNVLKAHRLYRQHLLTFGARESVPKIHAPMDDLPPTETSSRISQSSSESFSSITLSQSNLHPKESYFKLPSSEITSSVYKNNSQFALQGWKTKQSSGLIPFEPFDFFNPKTYSGDKEQKDKICGSLCSMYCIKKRLDNVHDSFKTLPIIPLNADEQQMHSTNLDLNTLKSSSLESQSVGELKDYPHKCETIVYDCFPSNLIQNPNVKEQTQLKNPLDYFTRINNKEKSSIWNGDKDQTTMFFFSRKNRNQANLNRNGEEYAMKKSRKSTNLVKYRNIIDEPCLRKPLVRHKILGKHKVNDENRNIEHVGVTCDIIKNEKDKKAQYTQDVMTASDYDMISEKLIFNLFDTADDKNKIITDVSGPTKSNIYMNQMVKELYDMKLNDSKAHPIKFLFKTLLQYYLKNTEGKFKGSNKRDIAVTKQSNTYFTKDKNLSNTLISEMHTSRSTMYSIQELEQLIKSTAYGCTAAKDKSRENDIEITKTLIDNLDASSMKCIHKGSENEIMSESTELPRIQETIEHLMSETSLSKAIAKDFLNAYLDVLRLGSNKSVISTSESSDTSKINFSDAPICDIQAECVQKKISKSVTTCGTAKTSCDGNSVNNTDPGQIYLKDMLEKMTSLFKCNKINSKNHENDVTSNKVLTSEETSATDEKEIQANCNYDKKRVYGIPEDNTIVIDLSEYDVDNVSMTNHATKLGSKYLTVDLKEKTPNSTESKLKNLSLKFTDNNPRPDWADQTKPCYQAHIKTRNPFMFTNTKGVKDEMDFSGISSEATSKGNFKDTESDKSFGDPYYNNRMVAGLRPKSTNDCDNFHSSITKDMPAIIDAKKKLKELTEGVFAQQGPWKRKERKSKIIDERFILRLLENLTLLSKNIPGIHKEINNLFLKLKNKHEKDISFSRLSLLGNIYKEKSLVLPRTMLDGDTQIDSNIFPEGRHNINKDTVHIAINTSFILPHLEMGLDKALSAIIFTEGFNFEKANVKNHKTDDMKLISEEVALEKERQSEPDKDEWFKKLTREYAETAAIKTMLEKYHQLPQSIRIAHPIRAKIPESLSCPRNSSITISELSTVSPPLKVSNHSQTRRQDKHKIDNFEVYQLFIRKNPKPIRSESLTESSVNSVRKDMSDDLKTIYRCTSEPSFCSGLMSPNAAPIRGPQAGFVSGTPGGRLAGWIVESGGPLESASRELGQAQLSVQQLQRLLDALELQQQMHHDTDVSLEGASPNVKKDRRKFGLRKKKSNSKCASVELAPPHVDPSSSHMALSTLTAPPSPGGGASSMPNSAASLPIACAAARPQSLPGAEALGTGGPASLTSLTPDHQLREDFTVLAKDLVANLKTVVSTLVVERGRLRAALEAAEAPAPGGVVAALRTNLSSALQQNSELRSRLSRIHDASDLAEISSVGNNSDQQAARPFPQSLSYSSSCVSASEFFDAEEHEDEKPAEIIATDEAGVIELDGDSSSEAGSISSDEGSASSDNSDGATSAVIATERPLQNGSEQICSRRARLPCPRPTPASPSLWNLLYKNIGKDLSQISMPVTINEPLNMLQRLCEELEYSELLDAAAACGSALERAALVAAFAVSAYAASAHRAASKPFNPLLGETYECVRPDRDFRFIAEQVSHHPPISACHAESPRWTFWQEARIKTKFWGKSMEFQPTGRVHVRLAPTGDHYSWNKVTTCVHNLFGGQRWVDQYGDMHITCHGTDITCKLQFIKASSWSSSRHEVRGVVAAGGAVRMRLAGRWSEGLHAGERPLWRPGAMPADYELYYGFTRFAMELNELEPGMRDVLPTTDTRLRPDQRALEEGDVDAAEQFKHDLEQAQRERRRDGQEHSALWFRKTIEDGEETWVFTGEYWKAREAGFTHTPRLW